MDYTSRKEEIELKKGGGEGKRVKSRKVRVLVEELWRKHGECDYWKLRAICCGSKVSEVGSGRESRVGKLTPVVCGRFARFQVVFKTPKSSADVAADSVIESSAAAGDVSMFSAADTSLPLVRPSFPLLLFPPLIFPAKRSSLFSPLFN